MAGPTTVRIDLKTVGPIAALSLVILVIIFVELCGRQDVAPLGTQTPLAVGPSPTLAATFTPGPSPTGAPLAATATQEAGISAAARDQARAADLSTIAGALKKYFDKHHSYPSTNGGIQSLCVFRADDQACKLEEVLKPLPSDPLTDPATNGYWYQSDGTTFVVFAQSETPPTQPCSEHPQHLGKFKNVICVRSP